MLVLSLSREGYQGLPGLKYIRSIFWTFRLFESLLPCQSCARLKGLIGLGCRLVYADVRMSLR
jgi:hypothetical protein